MNYFYITGSSSGIGKALTDLLLQDENNSIIGLSRTNQIENTRYEHHQIDLGNIDEVLSFNFPLHSEADKVVLINNAGTLGHVTQIGNMNDAEIQKAFNVNLTAPAVLINKFVKTYKNTKQEKIILNTSSGAARHTVTSWSVYCSSKAGIDMFSNVLEDEQKDLPLHHKTKIFSVAPGIVDTAMQDKIRSVPETDFKDVSRFITFKKENMLTSPEEVARKFADIIHHPANYPEVIMDLREL